MKNSPRGHQSADSRVSAWFRFCAFAVLSAALSGCSTLWLHSDTRQKQGETAAAAWKEVDLKVVFAAERENQAKLLETETAAWGRQFANRHEAEIQRLAREVTFGQYSGNFDDRLSALIGPLPAAGPMRSTMLAAVDKAKAALENEKKAQLRLDNSLSLIQSGGIQKFTCEQLMANPPDIVNAWKLKNDVLATFYAGEFTSSTTECSRIASARSSYQQAISSFSSGAIATRLAIWKKAQDDLLKLQADADQKKVALNTAQKAYDDEVEALKKGTSTVEKVKEKGTKVRDAIDTLQGVGGIFGVEFASKERITRIDDLLISLSKGETLATDTASKLEIGVSMLPPIVDDAKAVEMSTKGRAAVPLLLQRALEQAKVASSSALGDRKRQEVELLSAILGASVRQAATYIDAISKIDLANLQAPRIRDEHLSTGFTKLSPDKRREFLEGMVYYFDAYSRQEAQVKQLELQRLGLMYATSTDMAEVNASVWVALVNASVTQAAEFSALGIKADDIDKLLGLVGLFYIGHGVNK